MKIYHSLAFKIAVSFIAVLLIIIFFATFLTAFIFSRNLNSYVRQSPLAIAEKVAGELQDELSGDASLNKVAQEIKELSVKLGAEIIIYDERGVPILTSGIDRSTVDMPWCEGPMGMRNSRTVTVPLFSEKGVVGFVGVVVNRETSLIGAARKFQQSMFYSLFIIAIFAIFSSLLIFILVSRKITKPIVEAASIANKISEGNYNIKIENIEDSEIGVLQKTLLSLAEKLKKIEERRMELASDIAHEFKTPLAVLKAHIEGIKDGIIEPTPHHLERLSEEIDRLSKLLDELKTIQMLDSNQITPKMEKINLKEFLIEMMEIYRPLAESKNLNVKAELKDANIRADKSYLQRIFENIFLNAVNYTDSPGTITVLSYSKDGNSCFEIQDTGIGINKDELPFVFDRFYRAEGSRSRKTGGSGLGLSIVKKLTESLNGQIFIESEPKKGTKVRVCFPEVN